jgi:malate permease and related proteins
MHIFDTLAPVMLLILLGAGLARIRFLGPAFIGELNKLTFWIALPALVFRASATAGTPPASSAWITLTVIAATVAALGLSWALAGPLGLPSASRRTFVECSFFGNLAYIGLPILAHSLGLVSTSERPELLATTAIAMTALTIANVFLAGLVLQPDGVRWGALARRAILNPVVLAGVLGLCGGASGLHIPFFADQTLRTVGGMAVPAALLCIGGSLLSAPLHGRVQWITAACAVKVAALPLVAWAFARALDLSPADTRIVLVFAACPTAAAAYTMASQMRGDDGLAAGAIAVSTIAAFASLALALAVT